MDALSVCPTDRRAVRRCALGALIAAAYEITNDFNRAHDIAIRAVRPLYGSATLVNVNDVRGHATVLALLDEVVAAMKRRLLQGTEALCSSGSGHRLR